MTEATAPEQYRGSLAIPNHDDRMGVTVVIDRSDGSVTLKFDEPVAGSAEWHGEKVLLMDRPKYQEIQFATTDLPVETVELTWKMNQSKLDNTIAGVVVARPNTVRVRGEKGFILTRV
ncbi:MAG: hypothetical protein J4G14_14260 [Dehalococcoidia bacterium]|nr:hypothetical protein [Dehalococcoidia bacterium]